jgi:hypothetical protein
LKDGGVFYVFDLHPLSLMFDTDKLAEKETVIKYPYFDKTPDEDDSIGGYAGEPVTGVKSYAWMYEVSDIINSLAAAGLRVEYFNEYPENFFADAGREYIGDGLYNYAYNKDKFPMSFSLKATV